MHDWLQHNIQKAILTAISDSEFHFDLPNLSEAGWEPLLSSQPISADDERERLEFVGDGLLHSVVGIELYKLFPHESPHFYTILRKCLNTNETFAHLMVKVGAHELQSPDNNKKAADAFEMCIAAYYMEHNFEALCLWVSNRFRPLMLAAAEVFDSVRRWEAWSSRSSGEFHPQRERYVKKMANVSFYTKVSKPRTHLTLDLYNFKQQRQKCLLRQRYSRTPGTSRARPSATPRPGASRTRAPITPLPKLFATPRPQNHDPLPPVQPASVAKMKTIIDLTLDSDPEEETEEDYEEGTRITPEPPSSRPMSAAHGFRHLPQCVRTQHPTPSEFSSPFGQPIDKLVATSSTPKLKVAPFLSRLSSDKVLRGTSTNPITVDADDDDLIILD